MLPPRERPRLGIADFAETIDCKLRRVPVHAATGREFFFCAHCSAIVIKPAGTERTPCPVALLVAEDLRRHEARTS